LLRDDPPGTPLMEAESPADNNLGKSRGQSGVQRISGGGRPGSTDSRRPVHLEAGTIHAAASATANSAKHTLRCAAPGYSPCADQRAAGGLYEKRPNARATGAKLSNWATQHLIADGHVHWHACFDSESLLANAWNNLQSAAREVLPPAAQWEAALLFTEAAPANVFEAISSRTSVGAWTVQRTGDAEALRVTRGDGARMLIIAGRQVTTREALEVLTIGTRERIPDGLDLPATLARARAIGAASIVPWGFGKWILGRGRLIRRTLESSVPGDFAVGDNGGRLAGTSPSPILELAARHGFRVFSGSDTLPFREQVRRVGRYGFILDDWSCAAQPAAALKARMLNPAAPEPRTFGRLVGPVEFVQAQIRMQLHKRLG
jgi:hypothetical protein